MRPHPEEAAQRPSRRMRRENCRHVLRDAPSALLRTRKAEEKRKYVMPLLEVRNLQVRVEENEILHGLSLAVNKGEVHAIMGRTAPVNRR